MWRLILPLLAIGVLRTSAQTLDSHEVNADRSITFRYVNGGARAVLVNTDATAQKLAMTRDANGVWTATTPADLPPEHYGYNFIVDGVEQLDPLNRDTRYNLYGLYDDVLVRGTPAMPWELTDIPHGKLEHRMWTTHAARGLPGEQERMLVYTPPGYDAKKRGGYPVLYLLHGWSQIEDDWTRIGQANLMLDTLIAQGKAVPMIVVMPLGYGDYAFALDGPQIWQQTRRVQTFVDASEQLLLHEVVPAVEAEFNVAKGRDNRAIAGLSMGGLQSLTIGLRHADMFGTVAGFSAPVTEGGLQQQLAAPRAKNPEPRILWLSYGTEDGSIAAGNREMAAWARARKLPLHVDEMPGKHNWLVWRQSLLNFAPKLFRPVPEQSIVR